ncbi:MAG: hypothetical protein B7X48_02570 [Acidiphilium sp. 34-60-192]|nr:MAG: hypothetical protein B7X48_02570 [Acidiphilium sp. 34-60-192]
MAILRNLTLRRCGLIALLALIAGGYGSARASGTSSATQREVAAGNAAFQAHDYRAALDDWSRAARAWHGYPGNKIAQTNLGLLYLDGDGVAPQSTIAARWYRRAAVQGDAQAQNNLGTLYEQGIGLRQNDRAAVHWYRLAAIQGFAPAEYNLAVMAQTGRGSASRQCASRR